MPNKEYWEQRFILLEKAQNAKGMSYLAELEREYRIAFSNIEADISKWYARFAKNNEITLAEAQKWLTVGELEEFKWTVAEYIKYGSENVSGQWTKQLENASARVHISRLDALKLQIRQQIENLYGNRTEQMEILLRDIYQDGYYKTLFEVQKGFGAGWDISAINSNYLDKVISKPWTIDNATFSDRIWKHKAELLSKLQTELVQSIIRGASPQEAVKVIARDLAVSKAQASRLVMTEKAYFASVSQKDAYKELDVERFKVVATLDDLTSEICQDFDGQVFDMKDYEIGVTAPPFHPNCRTVTVPYFEDNYIAERAARSADGKTYYVPGNITYHEWKEKYLKVA